VLAVISSGAQLHSSVNMLYLVRLTRCNMLTLLCSVDLLHLHHEHIPSINQRYTSRHFNFTPYS
jgi:hypothetical protein